MSAATAPPTAGRYLKPELVEKQDSPGGIGCRVYFNGLWKIAPAPGITQEEVHAAYKHGHWISFTEHRCSREFLADKASYNS